MLKININKLLNTIIIVLCVGMVICGVIFIESYKDTSWDYYPDKDAYIWYISEKKYSELATRVCRNRQIDNPQGDLKECIAVAEYFINTSYYKMYEEVGDVEKADKYLARMGENRSDVGELSFAIADINEELKVNLVYPID